MRAELFLSVAAFAMACATATEGERSKTDASNADVSDAFASPDVAVPDTEIPDVAAEAPLPPDAAVQVSVGGQGHACVLTAGGDVRCWGASCTGAVGVDATAKCGDCKASIEPTPKIAGLPPVRRVIARHDFSCALAVDGSLWCWGHGRLGLRADGMLPAKSAFIALPEKLPSVHDLRWIEGGTEYLVALGDDGRVQTWGSNYEGELGYETTQPCSTEDTVHTCSATPRELSIGARARVSSSTTHSCALDAKGGVVCWGGNQYGELGDGTTTWRWEAKPVVGLPPVVSVSAGMHKTCAVTASGDVYCWGIRDTRFYPPKIDTVPKLVTSFAAPVRHIEAADASCAILTTGRVQCWGENVHAMLGNPSAPAYTDKPIDVVDLKDVVDLSLGSFACAVTGAGEVYCWGERLVGDAIYVDDAAPRKVPL